MTQQVATISFSWEALEESLLHYAHSPAQQRVVPLLVSALRKQYLVLDEMMLLHELLSMAACVSDPNFAVERRAPPPAAGSPPGSGLF
jgi:hypothetical protein